MADAVRCRLELLNGSTPPPHSAASEAVSSVCEVISGAAETIVADLVARGLFDPATPVQKNIDVGRLIAAIDTLHEAKNLFCNAIFLAHAPKQLDLAALGAERATKIARIEAPAAAAQQ